MRLFKIMRLRLKNHFGTTLSDLAKQVSVGVITIAFISTMLSCGPKYKNSAETSVATKQITTGDPSKLSYLVTKSGGYFDEERTVILELAPDVSQDVELKDISWKDSGMVSFKITLKILTGQQLQYTLLDDEDTILGRYPIELPFEVKTGETYKSSANIRGSIERNDFATKVLLHY